MAEKNSRAYIRAKEKFEAGTLKSKSLLKKFRAQEEARAKRDAAVAKDGHQPPAEGDQTATSAASMAYPPRPGWVMGELTLHIPAWGMTYTGSVTLSGSEFAVVPQGLGLREEPKIISSAGNQSWIKD